MEGFLLERVHTWMQSYCANAFLLKAKVVLEIIVNKLIADLLLDQHVSQQAT